MMSSSKRDRITFELTAWLQSYCITSYGSGWNKDVINQCLEFVWMVLSGLTKCEKLKKKIFSFCVYHMQPSVVKSKVCIIILYAMYILTRFFWFDFSVIYKMFRDWEMNIYWKERVGETLYLQHQPIFVFQFTSLIIAYAVLIFASLFCMCVYAFPFSYDFDAVPKANAWMKVVLHCALGGTVVTRTALPAPVSECSILCVQTVVWLPVCGIFSERTDVDACDCTQGLYGLHTIRVSTGIWLWEKSPLLHWGLEPVSVLLMAFQSGVLPTELLKPLFTVFSSVTTVRVLKNELHWSERSLDKNQPRNILMV